MCCEATLFDPFQQKEEGVLRLAVTKVVSQCQFCAATSQPSARQTETGPVRFPWFSYMNITEEAGEFGNIGREANMMSLK